MAADRLYKIKEVAEALNCSRSKTYELIASRELPSITIGKSRRVTPDQLRATLRRKVQEEAGR